MPTGDRVPARGFTYLWLLFVLAAGGAALAALGTQWQTAMQRERETELVFRGEAIVHAIESWARATPAGRSPWPQRLEDLLEDGRGAAMRRHLRRIPDDPFTGRPDWVLLTDEDQRIHGVRSRSDAVALRAPAPAAGASSPAAKVSDRRFVATSPAAATASAASAPSAAASSVRP